MPLVHYNEKCFCRSDRKLFQQQRLTVKNVFPKIAWIGTDLLAMPERCAHAST